MESEGKQVKLTVVLRPFPSRLEENSVPSRVLELAGELLLSESEGDAIDVLLGVTSEGRRVNQIDEKEGRERERDQDLDAFFLLLPSRSNAAR